MRKTTQLAALALLAAGGAALAQAQAPERPATRAGDHWTYRSTKEIGPSGWSQTRDDITVTRVTSTSVYYKTQESGSSQPPRDVVASLDWGRVRDVNGKETLVNEPLSFPLAQGRTWTVTYREEHPNKAHRFEEWKTVYTVVGHEQVTVPAGTFDAVKVEAEGHWRAEMAPSTTVVQDMHAGADATSTHSEARTVAPDPVEGRLYKAVWYVPAQRRWVKSLEEYYGGNGVRNERYTTELESSALAP